MFDCNIPASRQYKRYGLLLQVGLLNLYQMYYLL